MLMKAPIFCHPCLVSSSSVSRDESICDTLLQVVHGETDGLRFCECEQYIGSSEIQRIRNIFISTSSSQLVSMSVGRFPEVHTKNGVSRKLMAKTVCLSFLYKMQNVRTNWSFVVSNDRVSGVTGVGEFPNAHLLWNKIDKYVRNEVQTKSVILNKTFPFRFSPKAEKIFKKKTHEKWCSQQPAAYACAHELTVSSSRSTRSMRSHHQKTCTVCLWFFFGTKANTKLANFHSVLRTL